MKTILTVDAADHQFERDLGRRAHQLEAAFAGLHPPYGPSQ